MEELKEQLKELIVRELQLDDVAPGSIESDAPLFGEGLGLDSIDALELAVAIERQFKVAVQPDDADKKRVFHSVTSLAEFIDQHQEKA